MQRRKVELSDISHVFNGGIDMKHTIKLSIQQIVFDFQKLVRSQERITILKQRDLLTDRDCEEYKNETIDMAERYLPNYRNHVPSRFFSDETDDYEKAGMLGTILYENFKEIFYQLV